MEKYFGKISEMDLVDHVLTCSPDATLYECVQILKNENIGCVVVIDPEWDSVVGIITERDYIFKVVGEDIDIKTETVEKYMSPNPICKTRDEELAIVVTKMLLGQFRHLIVVDDNGKLESVFSIRDILSHIVDKHL